MDDLRSRAVALLRRPCCVSRDESRPAVADLIRRYADGAPWDAPELREHLSRCLGYALTRAKGPGGSPDGPDRDAQSFYKRAVVILQEIQAAASADPDSRRIP